MATAAIDFRRVDLFHGAPVDQGAAGQNACLIVLLAGARILFDKRRKTPTPPALQQHGSWHLVSQWLQGEGFPFIRNINKKQINTL
jgi:hypothetical protein